MTNPITAYLEHSSILTLAYIPQYNYFDLTLHDYHNPLGSVFIGKCTHTTPRGSFIHLGSNILGISQGFTKTSIPVGHSFIGQCIRPVIYQGDQKNKLLLLSNKAEVNTPYVSAYYQHTWNYKTHQRGSLNFIQRQKQLLQQQLERPIPYGILFHHTAENRLLARLRPFDTLYTNQRYILPDVHVQQSFQSLEPHIFPLTWDDMVLDRLHPTTTITRGSHTITIHYERLITATFIDIDAPLDIPPYEANILALSVIQKFLQHTQPLGLIVIDFITMKKSRNFKFLLQQSLQRICDMRYTCISFSPSCLAEIHGHLGNHLDAQKDDARKNFSCFSANVPNEGTYFEHKHKHDQIIAMV